MYQRELDAEQGSFQGFLFMDSACFEGLGGDYWNLLYKPVPPEEKDSFYHKKLDSCTDILAIIASEGGARIEQQISQFLQMHAHPQLVSRNSVIEYMVYEKLARLKPESTSIFDFLRVGDISGPLQQISFDTTNIFDFLGLFSLDQKLGSCLQRAQAAPQRLQRLLEPLSGLARALAAFKQNTQTLLNTPPQAPAEGRRPQLAQVSRQVHL